MRKAVEFTLRGTAAALIALTCGCVTGGKPPAVAGVPPSPQPPGTSAAVSAPELPLSYPQTVVRLPRPQPIPQDSIAEPPSEEPPIVRPASRGRAVAGASSKEIPALEVRTPDLAKPVSPPPESAVPPAPPRADDNSLPRLQIATRIQSVKDMLGRLGARKRTADLDASVARVQSLLTLAKRALDRRDLHQADSLTERAEVIARDLLRVP